MYFGTEKIIGDYSAVLLGSLTLLLSTRVPFPNKISCFVSTCVSSDNSFLRTRAQFWALEGVPLPATTPLWIAGGSHLCSVQSKPFSKTLISVANVKIGLLKEFSTSHF